MVPRDDQPRGDGSGRHDRDRRESDGPLGFGDSGDAPETDAEAERRRYAHRVDPDLRAQGEGSREIGDDIPVPRTAGASRYGWFLGVVLVLALSYITVNTFRNDGPEQSSRGVETGGRLPQFAAPLAIGRLADGDDVNVATPGNTGRDTGVVPACQVRSPDVLNICDLYAAGPVVLAFFATRGAECSRELDALDDVRKRHPGVQFAAVAVRGERSDIRKLVQTRGWGFPVAYDNDGILANAYGVAVCPQITYALPGGVVTDTSLGELGARGIDARVQALERRSKAKGWNQPPS